ALDITEATTAYDYCQGSDSIIVGLVDSGIDLNHPDLIDNIWVNPGEDLNQNGIIETGEWNGVDDEGNGFVDDFWGWNVWQNNNDVQDPSLASGGGHGSHCSGDASSVTNNATGIASLGFKAKIMMAKAGLENIYAGFEGVSYCMLNEVNIISLSWGGTWSSQYEQDVVNDAWDQGIIIFASAGNENTSELHYPSGYTNVVGVAATTQSDQKAGFSNYGSYIDVCAPGVSIRSTTTGNTYSVWDGTSMSCPIAAGLAALIWAAKPSLAHSAVVYQIYLTCDDISAQNPSYIGQLGWGRINAGEAISSLFPNLFYTEQVFDDSQGNGDGRPDPGETVDYLVTVENEPTGMNAFGVTLTLECSDPDVNITQSSCTLGDIPLSGSANNHANPFTLSVNPTAQPHSVTFVLTLSETSTNLNMVSEIDQMIGRPPVIVIDDDGGWNYEQWYQQDLNTADEPHDVWDVNESGEISESELLMYDTAIWHTSNADNPLSANEQTLITSFLNSGKNLFLTGEDIDEQLAGTDFYTNVLHSVSGAASGIPQLIGVTGDLISNGTTLILAGSGGAANSQSPAVITPGSGAYQVYTYSTGPGAGIRWASGDSKLIYFAFNFEAASGIASTPRATIWTNIFNWFNSQVAVEPEKEQNAVPSDFALYQNSPNPFNPNTEIRFALPKMSQVSLAVYDLAGRNVATLVNSTLEAGEHRITFDATNLASGMYICQLQAGNYQETRKMILLK
ncbi:MAG: S8 family serine peptidase, partial [bacterium]